MASLLHFKRPFLTALGLSVLLGLANLQPCSAQESHGLLITPLNYTTEARGGAKSVAEFKVSNGFSTATVIDVTLKDIAQDASGSPVLSDPGTNRDSAAKFVTVTQGKITIAPGKDAFIRANISVPSGLSGSYHAALVLRLFDTDSAVTGSVASVVNQSILPIHIFIAGTQKPSVELKDAVLAPAEGNIQASDPTLLVGKWVLIPRVQNTGNVMVRIRGDITITSKKGELVGRYQVSNGDPDGQAILPDGSVAFPIFIDSTLPDDEYPARLNLKFKGTKRTEGYTAPLTLHPHAKGAKDKGEVTLGNIERTGLQALVEPRVVIGNVEPNSLRTQRITVTNFEDFPVDVVASPSGLAIDVDGEPIALPDATTATWMTLAPSTFRIGAQQNRVVSVRMNAPTDQGDRWGLLQFAISSAVPSKSTLTTVARTVVLLHNSANPENGAAHADGVALTRSADGPILSVTISNPQDRPLAFSTGNLQLTPDTGGAPTPQPAANQPDALNSATTPLHKSFSIKGEGNVVLLPKTSRRLDFQIPGEVEPIGYSGLMHLTGITPTNGKGGTPDFEVPFKLNLTVKTAAKPKPAPGSGKPAAPAKPKVPAKDAKPKVPVKTVKPAAKPGTAKAVKPVAKPAAKPVAKPVSAHPSP